MTGLCFEMLDKKLKALLKTTYISSEFKALLPLICSLWNLWSAISPAWLKMNGAWNKIKNYELFEFNLFVSIRIDSEDVPKDIIQLFLRSFLQNLNNKGFKFSFIQISFWSNIIFVEIFLQFTPNQFNES